MLIDIYFKILGRISCLYLINHSWLYDIELEHALIFFCAWLAIKLVMFIDYLYKKCWRIKFDSQKLFSLWWLYDYVIQINVDPKIAHYHDFICFSGLFYCFHEINFSFFRVSSLRVSNLNISLFLFKYNEIVSADIEHFKRKFKRVCF